MDFPILPGTPASMTLLPNGLAAPASGPASLMGYRNDPPDHAGLMPGVGLSLAQMGVVSSNAPPPAMALGPSAVPASSDDSPFGMGQQADGFAQLQQQFRQAALLAGLRSQQRPSSAALGYASAPEQPARTLIAQA